METATPIRRRSSRVRRLAGGLALAAAATLACLGTLEIALQIASAFVGDRAGSARPEARHRILCVGDSHTFGGGVPPEEAYPSHLQRLLDRQAPKRFHVMNLGVPGSNTTQIRDRLPVQVGLFDPSLIIVWSGVNNAWNVTGVTERSGLSTYLDGFASRSRLYRLVRVWLHDRRLDKGLEEDANRARPKLEVKGGGGMGTPPADTTMIRKGRRDVYRMERRKPTVDDAMEERAYRDFLAMSEFARASGIEIVFVAYPMEVGPFGAANRALRRVAEQSGAAVVEASGGVMRLPPEKREYMWAGHPTAPIYREVAVDLAPHVLALDP